MLEVIAIVVAAGGLILAVASGRRLSAEQAELERRLLALEAELRRPAPADPLGPALAALRDEVAELRARLKTPPPPAPCDDSPCAPPPPPPRPDSPILDACAELSRHLDGAQLERTRFSRERLTALEDLLVVVPEIYDLVTQGSPLLRPEARQALNGLLLAAGLSVIEPRRGEPLDVSRHSVIRTERTDSDELRDCVGERISSGFTAAGQVVRKAEVTVYR